MPSPAATRPLPGAPPIAFDGGGLLIPDAERLLVLNPSAFAIRNALDAGCDTETLAATIAAAHDIAPARVRGDIAALARQWEREAERARERAALLGDFEPPSGAGPAAGWAARWTVAINGLRFGFAVEDERHAESLRLLLRHLEVDGDAADTRLTVRGAGPGRSILCHDGAERARILDGIGLRETVQMTMLRTIWRERPPAFSIHGGSVGRDGKALCFAAFAGSGKTTLIAHLIARGFVYRSDDLTAVTADGAILPWPVPLSVKRGSWPALAPLHPGLGDGPVFATPKGEATLLLPGPNAWDAAPAALDALVFPRFRPAGPCRLERLRPFAALEALIAGGLWLGYPITEEKVRLLLGLLERVPAYSLEYGALAEAEAAVDDVLGRL